MSGSHIYLVPGFFGFVQLGAINYFNGVKEALDAGLRKHNITAKIIECPTQPTGSIKNQADRLIQVVLDSGGLDADQIHFVGHSTGGLNARLLVSPGVQLQKNHMEEKIGAKTRTVITLATPHYGAPLASFFTSFQGRNILLLLTLLATSAPGRQSIFLTSRLLEMVARIDRLVGRDKTFLDELSNRLLKKLTLDPADPIWRFISDISTDQGAIVQLTPESMHIFNAAVSDRPNISYRCLLTAVQSPRPIQRDHFTSIDRAALAALFTVLYQLAAREHRHYPYPALSPKMAPEIESRLPFAVSAKTNDGIVPTLSQVYGELIDVVAGDHLDVVGQFKRANAAPLDDWLPSGAGFDEARFTRVWDGIAAAIAVASGEPLNLMNHHPDNLSHAPSF